MCVVVAFGSPRVDENMCCSSGIQESGIWLAIKRARLVPACVGVALHAQHVHVRRYVGWLELFNLCLFVLMISHLPGLPRSGQAWWPPSLQEACPPVSPRLRAWDEEGLALAACACVNSMDGMRVHAVLASTGRVLTASFACLSASVHAQQCLGVGGFSGGWGCAAA